MIAKEFGYTKQGEKVTSFTLLNDNGMRVVALDYGATIQSIFVPNKQGDFVDVVLGYDDIASYEEGSCYYGAVVGRYANRIGDARFTLDGVEYTLDKNSENGLHHLHGVYAHRMFKAHVEGDSLVLRYLSPDGEEGFPGNLNLEVRYSLSEDNALQISYKATTDKPTILNITNHCYFNLNGGGSTVFDHLLWLNCSAYTEYEETFSQTGRIIPVQGTPLDFRKEMPIGARFDDDYHQFRICTGYDHNMALDGDEGKLKPIGTVRSEKSGIKLEAFTTEPAIQLYSANFIHYDSAPHGKGGIRYPKNGGICLEAQHFPDSMNYPHFPNVILRPNEVYTQRTIYRFKVEK